MVVETIIGAPAFLAIFALVIASLAKWQRGLTYRQYIVLHKFKSFVARKLDSWARKNYNRPLIHHKRYRLKDDEFVETRDASPKEVFMQIKQKNDASPHLVASTKTRKTDDGERQYSHSHLVKFIDEGRQLEWYLFKNNDGTTDIYAHTEAWIKDPVEHLTDADQEPIDE